MNEAHKKHLKVFAALLPLLAAWSSFASAFFFATLLAAAALAVTHLFIILKPCFPARLFRVAVILFLAAVFQVVQGVFHPFPFWGVSLALLLDWDDFDPKHLGPRPLPPLVRASLFWSAALFIGILREGLGKNLGVLVFDQPAGILAGLSVFSLLALSLEKPLAPLWLKRGKRR